jgi:Ca2+-binding EF-hand superfamily protein
VRTGVQLEISRLQHTSNIISTLLQHKGINVDDGFSIFDADADGKLSMADLDSAVTERLSLDAVHVHELAVWFRHYNTAGDGFMTPQEWRTALNYADPAVVALLKKHNSNYIIEEQEQIQMESLLQQADSLLNSGAANVHGSLHADDNKSSTSDSSLASSPPSSAGSGGSFELESEPLRTAGAPTINAEQAALRIQSITRGVFAREQVAVKKQESWKVRREQSAIKIQARARGMQIRNMRANTHQNRMKASAGERERVSASKILKKVVSKDEVNQMKAQHQAAIRNQAAVSIQKRARGMLARSNFRPSVSAGGLRSQNPSTHAGITYSGSEFEQDENNYDEEFEDEGEPRWIGAECDAAAQILQAFCRTRIRARDLALLRGGSKVKTELLRRDTSTCERNEARQAELEKQRQERIQSETSSVISVQIDMIEADWAAAKRHKSVLKYATQILAGSIVDDLVEATVERQEALKAKQERELIRRKEEENRGYRKPRILEAITEYIKNTTHEELRAQEQLFSASNDWFQQRGQQLRILQQRKQAQEELAKAEKTADYIAARRAKVDAIYAEREKEKQVKQQQVAELREHRRREKIELANFVTQKKLAEEARAEEEFKATVALDAQRRRQVILAQVHKERMIEEKEKLHELGVKAARRRVLKEEKKEREFQIRAQALEKKKKRRDEERKKQREKMMVLYDKALEVADVMRSSKSENTPSGAKDPNETLKFAIGVYFSDPSNSMVASKTKKMMGDLMFAQKEGDLAWTEKRVEARLREIFQWMDKDGTGQVCVHCVAHINP